MKLAQTESVDLMSSEEDRLVRSLVDPYLPQTGSTFIDIGANSGRWSNYLSPRFAKVIAVEPEPAAYQSLYSNMAGNVLPVLAALWSEPILLELYLYSSTAHASIFGDSSVDEWGRLRGRSTGGLFCAATTLDHLAEMLDVKGCDLIMIDTEGSEDQVVKGGLAFIEEQSPELIIRVHLRESSGRIEEMLVPLGYVFHSLNDPALKAGSTFSNDNLWLVCEPRPHTKQVKPEIKELHTDAFLA